jgi:thymidylate synthase (FAD)
MLNIIRQSHEVWGECPTGFEDNLRLIEKAGRICWQSEEKTTDDSYIKFCDMLVEKAHVAMVEHSWLVIAVRARQAALDDSKFIYRKANGAGFIYAGNYRAYMEAMGMTKLEQIKTFFPAQVVTNIPLWAKAVSVKFITNRAMSHELVRHRPSSYAQLSQRYVDHAKGIDFILPIRFHGKTQMNPKYDVWYEACDNAAEYYKQLREYKESPQEARDVLPNSTATEILITCPLPEWWHIFKLRCSAGADPTMRALMGPVRDDFEQAGWLPQPE